MRGRAGLVLEIDAGLLDDGLRPGCAGEEAGQRERELANSPYAALR
jgi:hypothetical protein